MAFRFAKAYHSDMHLKSPNGVLPNRFLVIQVAALGDVLATTSICNTLRLNYPEAQIDYMMMDWCVCMAQMNPNITNIIPIDSKKHKNLSYNFILLMKIRKTKYDVLIDSQGNAIGLFAGLFSGAKIIIGFNTRLWQISRTIMMPFKQYTQDLGNGCLIDNRFALLLPLNLKFEDRSIHLKLSAHEKAVGFKLLKDAGVNCAAPTVIFDVNTKAIHRRWSMDNFIFVAQWLIGKYNAQIIISGSPDDYVYDSQLKRKINIKYKSNIFDNIKSTMREFCTLVYHSDLHIGNDSGPRHIAQALNIPSLCISTSSGVLNGAVPTNSNKFIDVSPKEAGDFSNEQWATIESKINPLDKNKWDQLVTPQFVISKLKKLIALHGSDKFKSHGASNEN